MLNLMVEDSGTFICIMNNTLGSQRIEIELVVKSPLETVVRPESQIVDLNTPAFFTCKVLGHPVSQITWFKDGRALQMGSR